MEKVIHISLKQGTSPMDLTAPTPTPQTQFETPAVAVSDQPVFDAANPSAVSVTIAGCGGCGINLVRAFKSDSRPSRILFFDTSMTNSRPGESVFIVTNGSGSGSNRAENVRDIERVIPQLSDVEVGKSDVAIVVFSLGGGSGSVIGPLLIRDYARRGMRVIGVAVADTSHLVGAKNTLNTLKTLTAIAKNNELYLPMIILSNDHASSRGQVDHNAVTLMNDLVDILTSPVYEVDRNDRLNWISPTKVVQTTTGLKLMSLKSEGTKIDDKLVLGTGSQEMVDGLLILQASPEDVISDPLPPARLKKTGFHQGTSKRIVGAVSSDISSVDSVIDYVEKMQNLEKAQKHSTVDRLSVSGGDDLIL